MRGMRKLSHSHLRQNTGLPYIAPYYLRRLVVQLGLFGRDCALLVDAKTTAAEQHL